jgi:hypothetical protein
MAAVRMQARSSTDGALYTWSAVSVDFAAAGYPGPGVANDVAVAMRPSSSAGGGTGDVLGLGSSVAHRLAGFANTGGKQLEQTSFLAADVTLRTGAVPFTADQSMGSHKLTTLQNGGTGTQDAANVAQVEALVAAAFSTIAAWKQPVRAATTGNITLSGAQTIDGVAVIAGDRVLVKNQTTASQNGIYVVASGAWARSTDADINAEVIAGLTVVVDEGTVNGPGATPPRNVFMLSTVNPIVVGTTALVFTAIGTVTADGTTLSLSGGTMSVAALGVGTAQLAADGTTFAKMQNIATDSLIGRDTASTGDPENILLDAATLQMDGSGNLRVPSTLGARGSENVTNDLYPNTQTQGTLATASSVTFDIPIPTGKRVQMTWDIWVDDGAGGACLYTKAIFAKAHQTGGAAKLVDKVVVSSPLESAGFTFDLSESSTNIRGTLGNTSGSTRSYNLLVGDWRCDKP